MTYLWIDLPLFLGRTSIAVLALLALAAAVGTWQDARRRRRPPTAPVIRLDERQTRNLLARHGRTDA